MEHHDHVRLLRKGIAGPGGVWADLGSGWGAFTLPLADLLGADGEIYSVDRDQRSLREQQQAMQSRFPTQRVYYQQADFTRPLSLPLLDGVVMANSLHFVRNKEGVLALVRSYLRPEGRLILVEYNTDHGNIWVPYPLSYSTWEAVADRNGFHGTVLLERVPSRFLREIYSALSFA